ncbi:peptidylprolyl isomerase [Luteimonas sp BLCC-B24]|uniref:FKBP-type peptidyl-prolyl cis-trans isomerase n=1 Tax=Luteimonas sp. BLCC-B24 TaxID=3025317 RepID=UPI00234C342E|nr:peptidylprolyl isomerase [Luteimonas sp. BLCC-B24]MDC7807174.1 peptidylprolyl isomerase [Luteimonas sp. BLCC-B24]
MEIADARVASFHYTLTDDSGAVLDQSPAAQPLQYLHGAGNIVPGLEQALTGRKAGDAFDVTVKPEDAYGLRNEQLIQSVPREAFQGVDTIAPGMQFQAQGPGGAMLVTVVSADDAQVRIDGNHPLAGRTLHFAVRVDGVREASADEQAEGRVAAPAG